MNLKKLYSTFFLPLIVSLLTISMAAGCSDDDDVLQAQYGYVQFKLYKTGTEPGTTTRAMTDKLERLSDAQKISVIMLHEGVTITQTLHLNYYNTENAEFGVRSDKLQLLAGTYQVVGYYLYDKVDELLFAGSAGDDDTFTVVERGLAEKVLSASTVARGSVNFRLIKEGLPETRAEGNYLFKDIKLVDVRVENTFTREGTWFEDLQVTYREDSEEHTNPDNPADKYKDVATATCDSAVWLPAGTYRVTDYRVYKKSGGARPVSLDTGTGLSGETFTVVDNQNTEDALIPVQFKATAEHIKDYLALKEIWESLGGPHWSFYGEGEPAGTNWNFNKEIDMWGDQPGVGLNEQGRVISLSLEGFGANGRVPDAIAQLSELKVLSFGSHNEKLSGRLFGDNAANMSAAELQKLRMHYKELFLDRDIREDFSEMIQESIGRDPEQSAIRKNSRITLKDTQIGQTTNNITFVSKGVLAISGLQQFYIANSPVRAESLCAEWEAEAFPAEAGGNEYYEAYKTRTLDGSNLSELTDVELYNCKNLDKFPDFVFKLPEMVLLNVACNKNISATQLRNDWTALTAAPSGPKLQILYLGYNNLEEFPEDADLEKMVKLGLLDCIYNNIRTVHKFGTGVQLSQLTLDYNEIEEIPEGFCAFTDQVESLSFAHNKLKHIPNIFDANSVYVMGSVDFSYNEIGSDNGENFSDASTFKGINASSVSLAYNQIKQFPKELFQAGSPITSLNLSNNLLETIDKGAFRDPSTGHNYKNSYLLQTVDLRFNKLSSLCSDFNAETLMYLSNMDVSYNCFSSVPLEPLNSSRLQAFGIRHQRDAEGNRILRTWPEGITTCVSLLQLQIGSNDIRKVNETMTPKLYILEIKDNPNISIDLTDVCPYIEAGAYVLIYDKTQDIKGCDALDIVR